MLKAGTGRVQGDHYKMIKTSGRFWLGGSTSSRETSPIYIYCSTGYGTLYWVVPAWFDVCIVGRLLVGWLYVGWLLAVQCNSIG